MALSKVKFLGLIIVVFMVLYSTAALTYGPRFELMSSGYCTGHRTSLVVHAYMNVPEANLTMNKTLLASNLLAAGYTIDNKYHKSPAFSHNLVGTREEKKLLRTVVAEFYYENRTYYNSPADNDYSLVVRGGLRHENEKYYNELRQIALESGINHVPPFSYDRYCQS